jgi:hypothetical protein
MRTLVVLALVLGANLLLVAASWGQSPVLPPIAGIVLAMVVNLTAGIRVGYQFASAYVEDVTRLNRLVVDQNSELIQANRELLERTSRSLAPPALHVREGQRA